MKKMKLLKQPRDGVKPIIDAIAAARTSVDLVVFRFDLPELERALQSAAKRGIAVHALIAHTSGNGNKKLRDLESRLLEAGATVARTDDEMVRYHGKLLLIDKKTLFVMGFNYTIRDICRSRSLGIVTTNASCVRKRRLIAPTRTAVRPSVRRM
jgi:phosphatidylserine/phosphatidylglycerophosphate/cardiolipin synthase-like enzyme